MPSAENIEEAWRERVRSAPLVPVMTFTEQGLVLGAGTLFAKTRPDASDMPGPAVEGTEERVLALLACAYGEPIGPRVLGNIRRASKYWNQGEACLASIELALSGLPRLPDEERASFRLFLADRLLADGLSPRELLAACGIDTAPLDLLKAGFNPDEPRVPAGNPDGGQWTYGGAEPESSAATRSRARTGRVNYTPVHGLPHDAVVVSPPDGTPIEDPKSPTKKLMAPPYANFRQIYAAGRAIASLPYSEQYERARGHRPGRHL